MPSSAWITPSGDWPLLSLRESMAISRALVTSSESVTHSWLGPSRSNLPSTRSVIVRVGGAPWPGFSHWRPGQTAASHQEAGRGVANLDSGGRAPAQRGLLDPVGGS